MERHVNHSFAFNLLLFRPSNIMNAVQCSEKWVDFFLRDLSDLHVLYSLVLRGQKYLLELISDGGHARRSPDKGAAATSSVRICCPFLREDAPRCAVCSCAPSYSVILLLGAWKTTMENWVNAKKGKKWPQGRDWLGICGFLLRTWPGFSPYWLKVESVWLRNPALPSETLLLTGANLNSTWSGLTSWP